MLILLPPSETKSYPTEGPKLSHPSLWLADELGAARSEVCTSLIAIAKGSKRRAMATLGLTPGLADEVAHNAALLTSPCAHAIDIYTGVLYEALGWSSLSSSAKKRGASQLRIFSALFGALRPLDPIPAYRLSMSVNLPKIGGLGNYWKQHLTLLDEQENQLVIDLRSQVYAKAWKPTSVETATVRVFVERNGKRTVVSHMAKKTRGEVARALLNLRKSPSNIETAAQALSASFEIELVAPSTSGKPYFIDVIHSN